MTLDFAQRWFAVLLVSQRSRYQFAVFYFVKRHVIGDASKRMQYIMSTSYLSYKFKAGQNLHFNWC